MQLKLNLTKKILSDILQRIDETNPQMEVEDYFLSLAENDLYSNKLKELSDDELKTVIDEMINFALNNFKSDRPFKANELYAKAFEEPWTKLSPSTRKSLGRRLRSAINEHWDEADDGDLVIEFQERNINNAALYTVTEKVPL